MNANDLILEKISRGDTLLAIQQLEAAQAEQGPQRLNRALFSATRAENTEILEAEQDNLLEQVGQLQGEEHAAAVYSLGCIALALDDVVEARNRFQDVLKIQPDNIMARHNQAYCCELLAEFEQAELLYTQVINQNQDMALSRLNLALLRLQNGEVDAALEDLHTLHLADPENLGLTLYLCRGLLQRGTTRDIEEIIDLVDGNPDALGYIDLKECRAQALLLSGESESAEKAFADLLEQNPESYFARLGLVKMLAERGAFDTLKEHVAKLQELLPSDELLALQEKLNEK
ncbi:MAG: tetratricopeptide repeat protein [Deltaproteobacteria bacterium]|nr:tetratricopeptide repeat protein [Deltaproteobacteria bacterium]